MYLKQLTLKGFKSFASATTLNFEPGITAIVGPNGSGKSNVVDALAWVMGEQGAKSLRGAKMEDVIFAGTSGRAPLGRAEVSLTIDNTDGVLPIDYTEVTISRTLFRTGGSEYAINGHGVRLLDVQELLSDTGMGREMHVIVGQGQLDQILQATPEARRGFIEEAAGVLKHRRRKDKAVRKLESTAANLARLTDLIAEIRRQLKPLGRQAAVARKAATVQAELRDAKARLLADDLTQAQLALDSDRAAEAELQTRKQTAEHELAAAREAEAALERQLDELKPRLAGAQENWYALAGLAERVTSTGQVAAERMRHGEAQPATPSGRDPEALEQEEAKVREQEAELAAEVTTSRQRLEQASADRSAAEKAEADEARRYQAQLRAIADRREGLAKLTGQVNSLQSRLQASDEEESRLSARVTEAEQRATEAEHQYKVLETRLGGVSDGEFDLDAGYEQALAEQQEVEEEISGLKSAEQEAEQRQAMLGARIDALRVGLQRRDASGALLASDPIDGLLGSLPEMITVDPRWQHAVSVALGAATEALVATGFPAVNEAFDRLKTEDLGRAGLLISGPADQTQSHAQPGWTLPGGACWAMDAITADPRLTSALRQLLGTVALVDDLAGAQALIADFPNLTAVTADGDLVSAWFASGGSAAQPSVIEVQASIDQARTELESAKHDAEQLRFRIAAANQRLQQATNATAVAFEQLNESDAQLTALTEQLSTWRQSGQSARVEADRLRQAIEQAGHNQASNREKLAELESRLEAAQSEDELAAPDATQRDRLTVASRQAREKEMDARLALRTAEERARSLAGRADSLRRAAQNERLARQKAQARAEQLRREATAARAVLTAAQWLSGRVEKAKAAAQAERQAAEESRVMAETKLGQQRADARTKARQLEELVEGEHKDQMARIEMTMRVEQLAERTMTELGMEQGVLVDEYGPDQLIPVITNPDGTPIDPETDEVPESYPFVRKEQESRLRTAERNLAALGKINPLALEEFEAMNERHQFLAEQLEDLKKTRKDLLDIIDQVDKRVQEVFAAAYEDVATTFSDVFGRLFPGGEGRLVLTDPADMLTTGIEVEARPAGKKVRRLSLLSGGERSLVAVGFLISLFIARPSPFYILDEVEAALDDINLSRLLSIYEELRENSQLLIITHQKRTMEIADALYGVTMRGDGVSTVISQRLAER